MSKIKLKFAQLTAKPEQVFLFLGLVFGLLSLALTPPLSQSDSDAHFQRAFQLSQGIVSCPETVEEPRAIFDKVRQYNQRIYSYDFFTPIDYSDTVSDICRPANSYSPVLYIPQVAGILVAKALGGSVGLAIYLGSAFGLLFYLLAMFLLIKSLALGRWVLTVLALTPQALQFAGSFSEEMVNSLAMVATIALVLNLFAQTERISRRQMLQIGALAVLAALTKSNNILLFLPLIFLPKRLFAPNSSLARAPSFAKRIPFNLQKWGTAIVSAGLFLATFLAWVAISGRSPVGVPTQENPLIHRPWFLIKLIFNTFLGDYSDVLLQGSFGILSSFAYSVSFPVILVICALLAIAFLERSSNSLEIDRRISKSAAVSTAATFFVFVAAICAVMYVGWVLLRDNRFDYFDGVQGRYFVFALLLFAPAASLLKRRVSLEFSAERALGKVIFWGMTAVLIYYCLITYKYGHHVTAPDVQHYIDQGVMTADGAPFGGGGAG